MMVSSMEPIYIYPGTFCPPHYGHVAIAKEAAAMFGKITVICSVNPVKEEKNIFSPEECAKMWQSYDLGSGIEVTTLDEFLKLGNGAPKVMVRGIRDDNDIKYEDAVILYNCGKFGIRHYHYILCEKGFETMSSTRARRAAAAGDLAELSRLVNPKITTMVIGKIKTK
jgi:pantetheine-phosphate adenylyltransferase